jgi:hypothetical protein
MHLKKIKKERGKRAEGVMSMPFGIIFSVILIIVFISVAIYVIIKWLDLQKCTQVGSFYQDLQDKVNEAYSGTGYKDWMSVSLPSGVKEVCFADLKARQSGKFKEEYDALNHLEDYDANTFLYPEGGACNMEYSLIEHLDLSKIIQTHNPYCISTDKDIEVIFEMYGKGVILREKV